MWSRNTVRGSSHISFFCGGDSLCVLERRPKNKHVCLRDQRVSLFPWDTSGPLSFALATSGSLSSVQIYRPYIVFSSPMRKYEHPLRLTYFSVCGWLLELTYFCFFLVICWSYLRTEISVTQSIGNKLYSLSCETTLLMLSCDRIESAKFIVASKASILHLDELKPFHSKFQILDIKIELTSRLGQ